MGSFSSIHLCVFLSLTIYIKLTVVTILLSVKLAVFSLNSVILSFMSFLLPSTLFRIYDLPLNYKTKWTTTLTCSICEKLRMAKPKHIKLTHLQHRLSFSKILSVISRVDKNSFFTTVSMTEKKIIINFKFCIGSWKLYLHFIFLQFGRILSRKTSTRFFKNILYSNGIFWKFLGKIIKV